jgi:hypothetical protein
MSLCRHACIGGDTSSCDCSSQRVVRVHTFSERNECNLKYADEAVMRTRVVQLSS